MVEDMDTPQAIAAELGRAKQELEAFESGVTRARKVERLMRAQPMHPVVWAARASLLVFGSLLVAALGWTGMVALGLPVPEGLMQLLESSADLPGPMILSALALCSLAFSAAMRELAAELGEDRPMLDWESREFQKLNSEVLRLKARQAVQARISATPAPVRNSAPMSSQAVA